MHPVILKLCQILYPISDTSLRRDRPLQVLALGLSRSATESLRNALVQLGYSEVHHGFRFITDTAETLQWIRLAHAQAKHDSAGLRAADFDRVLGDCMAVTDTPSAGFAHELIDAYPDAQVILNYRDDVDAWYTSTLNTVEKFNGTWKGWLLTWFQSELFWQQRSFYWLWRRHFDSNFGKNGKTWYRGHYRRLEEHLTSLEKPYLRWRAEDGWAPLCEFLDKPIPKDPFPSGNTPAQFATRMQKIHIRRTEEAHRNLRISMAVLIVLFAIGVGSRILH